MEDVSPAPAPALATHPQEHPGACLLAILQLIMEGEEKMFLILGFLASMGFLLASLVWDRS